MDWCNCAVCRFPAHILDEKFIQDQILDVEKRLLHIQEWERNSKTYSAAIAAERMLAKAEMELLHLRSFKK